MVDIQTASIVIASASVVLAAIYYLLQIRHQSKMRLTDTTFRLYSGVSTKEAVEAYSRLFSAEYTDYDEFVKKYGPPFSENPVQISFGMVSMVMEGLGLSFKKKLVDMELIYELFPVPMMWGKVKPVAEGMRKQFNNPHFYEWAEFLYNEYVKYSQKRKQQLAHKTA